MSQLNEENYQMNIELNQEKATCSKMKITLDNMAVKVKEIKNKIDAETIERGSNLEKLNSVFNSRKN
jgi:hypothetical protein